MSVKYCDVKKNKDKCQFAIFIPCAELTSKLFIIYTAFFGFYAPKEFTDI